MIEGEPISEERKSLYEIVHLLGKEILSDLAAPTLCLLQRDFGEEADCSCECQAQVLRLGSWAKNTHVFLKLAKSNNIQDTLCTNSP